MNIRKLLPALALVLAACGGSPTAPLAPAAPVLDTQASGTGSTSGGSGTTTTTECKDEGGHTYGGGNNSECPEPQ
jgi:hypothetical protein